MNKEKRLDKLNFVIMDLDELSDAYVYGGPGHHMIDMARYFVSSVRKLEHLKEPDECLQVKEDE